MSTLAASAAATLVLLAAPAATTTDPAPWETPAGVPAVEPCSTCEAAEPLPQRRVTVTDGYQDDGHVRPFWWASDGLHFTEPIPANGYVNINVPGANNVSIDTNRELIGQTFIPWPYFGLEPGMCITWTESNGYDYHFGEDNSGRGGVNENGWQYCVSDTADPDVPVDPDVPTDPETPVDPDVPADPETPVDPDAPVEPDVPADPDTPTDPDTPAGPDTPTDTPTDPATPGDADPGGTEDTDDQDVPAASVIGSADTAEDAPQAAEALASTGVAAGACALGAAGALTAGAGLLAARRRRAG